MRRRALLSLLITAFLARPAWAGDVAPGTVFNRLKQQRLGKIDKDNAQQAKEPTVGLNIFNETWPNLLQTLAEESGSVLVLKDSPPGRLTRVDLDEYTRAQAVKILNNELAPKGFRIIENGKFLIVLSDRTFRHRYAQPVVPREQTSASQRERSESEEFQDYERHFQTIVPAGGTATGENVVTAGGTMPPRDADFSSMMKTPKNAKKSSQPGPPVTLTIHARQSTAVVLARRLHEAFGRQSHLLDAGATGLPAFRVAEQVEGRARPVSFEVEIDTQHNELRVTAPQPRAKAVAEILRGMDTTVEPGEIVKVAPADAKEQWLGGQLGPVLAQIDGGDGDRGDGRRGGDRDRGDRGDRDRRDRDGRRRGVPNQQLLGAIGNLAGDVTIEAIPGMDVLILRGSDEDVQAVLAVIQQLKALAVGQQPIIEIVNLKHLNSAALATLLGQVYEQMATVRTDDEGAAAQVAAIPLVKPNAVLVIAPEGEMPAVLDLVEKLDAPVAPATEFEVFRLENSVALSVVETLETFYAEREGLGTRITVVPNVRSNSLIVAARPADLKEIAALIQKIDENESALVTQMKIFRLRSASADELAQVITQAITSVINPQAGAQMGPEDGGGGGPGPSAGGGETAESLQAARSAVIAYLDITGEGPRVKRSGLLADIRMTPDPRTNSLIVTADEESFPFIKALIEQLDRPASATAQIKIFTLQNSEATATVELLRQLFGLEEDGDNNGPQFQPSGATGGLVPLRFGVDTRTNSIIASGSAGVLNIVRAILLTLDSSDIRERQTTVIELKNAPALAVSQSIQQFLTAQRQMRTTQEGLVSTIQELKQEVIVVPEPVSNSLLVSATPRYFETIRDIIAQVDKEPPQVIIQCLLVQVSLNNTDEFGIQLGLQGSTLFDRSLKTIDQATQLITISNTSPNGVRTTTQKIISEGGQPGYLFNNSNPLGNNLADAAGNPSTIGSQGLTNFALGRANSDLGFGGFVFSASSANVNMLLRALSAKRTVHILSRPQIRTLDNQPANVLVGQYYPVVTGATISNNFVTPLLTRLPAGLMLGVTPRISPDGNVVMEVQVERSQFSGGVPVVANTSGSTIESPIKNLTRAMATVSVPTGQTIVLGGIITRNDETIERKVPYLGDVPYLGLLFRYDSTTTKRQELLVFLTPRVIYNSADNELIKQVEADRLHFIEREAEEIHGPLYGIPPAAAGPRGMPPMLQSPSGPVGPLPPGQGMLPPPGAKVLPGVPPGSYPPGTLYPLNPAPTPSAPPAQSQPQPQPQAVPPAEPAPRGSVGKNSAPSPVTPGGNYETIRTTGPAVMGQRLSELTGPRAEQVE